MMFAPHRLMTRWFFCFVAMEWKEAQVLTIGGVAARVGWSTQRLRELEAAGVIPTAERTEPGGYRVYTEAQVEQIIAVKRDRVTRHKITDGHDDG